MSRTVAFALDLAERAVGDDPSLVQNHGAQIDGANEAHIMLNHDDGNASAQSEQKIGRCACLLRGHSGGRLVQEQKLRPRPSSAMPISSHCLWPCASSPRIQISSVGEPEQLDQFADARGALRRLDAAAGNFEIVAHGQTLEQARHLEFAHDTEPREVVDGSSDDVVAFEADACPALAAASRPAC